MQDGLFGTPYGLYTGSSAFENELGVQPPVGFWDPLGFTKTDDALSFRRRRYVEVKHGRVAMFACLGYIVPMAASFMKTKQNKILHQMILLMVQKSGEKTHLGC